MKKYIFFLTITMALFANENKMQIFQPPTSTCPQSWLDEMRNLANDVDIVTMMNVKNIKNDVGIPKEIQSCNTSFLNDYVFEGNVPSQAIKDFFKSVPKGAIGLSLPSYENDKTPKTVYVIFENKTYKEFGKY